ncbi:MAG TPA: hypothetical protein VFD05_04625 [Bacilli bacterium]|nr:hypothetical protein [Bacilli bacterium]
MSELKGQILGVLLVILMFGIISGTMKMIFNSTTSRISSEYDQAISNFTATTP